MTSTKDAYRIAVAEAKRLQRLRPRLSAVGVGGSLGRAAGDAYSDIDLFLFFDEGDAFEQARWLLDTLDHIPPPVSAGEPDFFPGFGVRLSFVLPNWGKTEYFVNTPTSWSDDPMRSSTEIIWDSTGVFSKLVAAEPNRERKASDLLHLALLASMDVAKHAARNDLVSLEYRLALARRSIAALAIAHRTNSALRVHDAAARTTSLPEPLSGWLSVGTERGPRASYSDVLTSLHQVACEIGAAGGDTRWAAIADNLATAAAACK
jgi:predicted nucleotidyltransferase